jgi:hypothetical protein
VWQGHDSAATIGAAKPACLKFAATDRTEKSQWFQRTAVVTRIRAAQRRSHCGSPRQVFDLA